MLNIYNVNNYMKIVLIIQSLLFLSVFVILADEFYNVRVQKR